MSALDELKNMLLTFRVSELQMLLGYAGQNKTGRKTELQARALDLLKNKTVPHMTQVHAKIRELYKSIQLGGSVVLGQGTPGVNSNPIDLPPNSSAGLPSSMGNPSMRGPPMAGFIPLTDQMRARNNQFLSSMYTTYNPKMMMNTAPQSQAAAAPGLVLYPEVKFKRLPFYDILGDLLKPTTLTANTAGREPTAHYVFFLSPRQASEVSMNREVGPGTRNEYVIQIQMRFCVLDTTTEQEDQFPPGCAIKINGKAVQLPNPVQTNKQGAEPKRPPRPINISHLVKLCPSVSNNVAITWNPDYQRGYVVVINLVRKLNSNDLLERLKHKGVRHADYTTGLIKDKLNDSDNDIATTILRVTLLCPLGKMRMMTPVRSSTCSHLQCFDGGVFLNMNEKRPTWTCPVCNKPAIYDNLVIDGYFQNVLDSPSLGDSNDIQLLKDGSWSLESSNEEGEAQSSSNKRIDSPKDDQIEEIKDDDDEDNCGAPNQNGDNSKPVGEKPPEAGKELVVVDLTETDDEDQPNPPPKASPPLAVPPTAKLDHVYSDSTSSLSTATRSPPSIINLDSPSPSPPPPMGNYSLPSSGVVSPPSNFMCHMRLAPDSRYHPY